MIEGAKEGDPGMSEYPGAADLHLACYMILQSLRGLL